MTTMELVMKWVREHPEFMALAGWPIITAILTGLFKPRTPEQYEKIAKSSPRLAALLSLLGAIGLDYESTLAFLRKLVSGQYDSADKVRKDSMRPPPPPPSNSKGIPPLPVLMLALVALSSLGSNCKPTPGPDGGLTPPVVAEAGTQVVNGVCTLLEGITQNQTLISACVGAEELATIASFITQFLKRAEVVDAGSCTMLGTTGVCATKQEIGQGIQLIFAKRRSLHLLDAGAK